mgnify:CR=1 FL=1
MKPTRPLLALSLGLALAAPLALLARGDGNALPSAVLLSVTRTRAGAPPCSPSAVNGSIDTVAVTPSIRFNFFSMRTAHEAHVMPCTCSSMLACGTA